VVIVRERWCPMKRPIERTGGVKLDRPPGGTGRLSAPLELIKRGPPKPVGILIPLEVRESAGYFVIEGDMPGLKAEELSVCVSSRIVTITVDTGSEKGMDEKKGRMSFSIYLDSPVAPNFGSAIFSMGRLYLKMLKDPTAVGHARVDLPICG